MEEARKVKSREELVSQMAEMLETAGDEICPFVDLTSQIVAQHADSIYTGIDMDEELDGHAVVDIKAVSSHEFFPVMEQFAAGREGEACDRLLRALSRRHPFGAFRSEVESLGLLQDWYDVKAKAYEAFAKERLDGAGVDFVDGKVVCTIPENIRAIVHRRRQKR